MTRPWTASEFGNPQDSIWRSSVAGLRGHAEGYDGFKANRSARPISKFGGLQSLSRSPRSMLTICSLSCTRRSSLDTSGHSFRQQRFSCLGNCASTPFSNAGECFTESRAVFKSLTRASLQRSNPTRNYAGSLILAASVSRFNCKTAPSLRTFHPSKPRSSNFSRSKVCFPIL
jgi:hypothetical protein